MGLDQRFLEFALLGSSWVLWLLVGLSVAAVSIALERGLSYRAATYAQAELRTVLQVQWSRVTSGELAASEALAAFARRANPTATPAARVCTAMLRVEEQGREVVDAISTAARARERSSLDGLLPLLGTIGANAPFIGLFGTVIDILGVFHHLGQQGGSPGANTAAIMAGLSGALVATAMGLLVAIPAVALYNGLLRRQDAVIGQIDEIVDLARGLIVAGETGGGRHGRGEQR